MLETKQKFISLLTLLIMSFCMFVGVTFAWFSLDETNKQAQFTASSIISYFGGGDGSETEDPETGAGPYIISDPIHLYNLAWLQNMGIFEEKKYFKLVPRNGDTLDMAGYLSGLGTESGAVPPIGTESKPFIGSFDGNGKVIKNLWVSSNWQDWKDKPDNYDSIDIGTKIGFFGSMAQEEVGENNIVADVKNLVLENLEVTTNVQPTADKDSVVGLIAGYVDGNLSNVGIKNGRISTAEAVQVTSKSSLVGEIGPNASWENGPPGSSEGNLLIDPNLENNNFSQVNANNVVPIPGSTRGNAYYSGYLQRQRVSGGVNTFLWYNDVLTLSPGVSSTLTATATSTNSTALTPKGGGTRPTNFDASMWNRMQNLGQAYYIVPQILSASTTAVNPDSNEIIPQGCIWFKPATTGVCTIAGVMTNKGSPLYLSFYTVTRGTNGNITNLKEVMRLVGQGNNKTMFIFNVNIPDGSENVEYVIGKPSGASNVAGFLYLILAGTGSSSSATGEASKIMQVDYVFRTSAGTFSEISTNSSTVNQVYFAIENSTLNGTICYNMQDYPNNDLKVYYKCPSGVVTDKLAYSQVGVPTTNDALFPSRQTTIPNSG